MLATPYPFPSLALLPSIFPLPSLTSDSPPPLFHRTVPSPSPPHSLPFPLIPSPPPLASPSSSTHLATARMALSPASADLLPAARRLESRKARRVRGMSTATSAQCDSERWTGTRMTSQERGLGRVWPQHWRGRGAVHRLTAAWENPREWLVSCGGGGDCFCGGKTTEVPSVSPERTARARRCGCGPRSRERP